MLETVCTRRKTIRIAGDDYPAELVKAKFMKLDSEHIRFVLDCMRENTTKIRNIKQYLTGGAVQCPVHYRQLLHFPCRSRYGERRTCAEKAEVWRPGLLFMQRGRKPVKPKEDALWHRNREL